VTCSRPVVSFAISVFAFECDRDVIQWFSLSPFFAGRGLG
jgi:hypothetical protein